MCVWISAPGANGTRSGARPGRLSAVTNARRSKPGSSCARRYSSRMVSGLVGVARHRRRSCRPRRRGRAARARRDRGRVRRSPWCRVVVTGGRRRRRQEEKQSGDDGRAFSSRRPVASSRLPPFRTHAPQPPRSAWRSARAEAEAYARRIGVDPSPAWQRWARMGFASAPSRRRAGTARPNHEFRRGICAAVSGRGARRSAARGRHADAAVPRRGS